MPNPSQLMAKSSGTDHANAAVASALRTLDAEGSGITAISAALQGALGPAFADAVDLIRQAKGRVIVTGLGKSGHVARKIAATLASTGTPAFFVHAAEASHGDLGMITPDDVIIALSWSGEQPEMKNLVNYSKRFAIPMIAVTANAASPLGEAAQIQHAAFMDELAAIGFVVLGGPLGDSGEAMLVVNAPDETAVKETLGRDPWRRSGMLLPPDIQRWTILLEAGK